MATELKDTLLLPKTDFPMRAGLAQREPGRVAHWEKLDLYNQIQARRANSPKGAFVLHDGPPFTNGDVHIGTALNKTLKDIVNRYKSMQGFRTPYVPGWDCHGLPIEQKVSKEIKEQNLTLTTAQMRAKCDEFSESWIGKQTAQFKRVGVLADWKNEYKTKAPAFEADIVRTFAAFIEQGLVLDRPGAVADPRGSGGELFVGRHEDEARQRATQAGYSGPLTRDEDVLGSLLRAMRDPFPHARAAALRATAHACGLQGNALAHAFEPHAAIGHGTRHQVGLADEAGDDRHEPAPAEEGEVGRQRDAVVALPQVGRHQTAEDAAEHAVVDQLGHQDA